MYIQILNYIHHILVINNNNSLTKFKFYFSYVVELHKVI